MNLLTRGIATAFAMMTLAGAATAAERAYVTATSVNCRSDAATTARVLERLAMGDPVNVLRREDTWTKIEPASRIGCWIASRYLSTDAPSAQNYVTSRPTKAASRASSKKSKPKSYASRSSSSRSSKPRRASPAYSSGSCPCSGSRICIGPRGGRYCITSGGNKRYGV